MSENDARRMHAAGPFGRLLRFWRSTFGLSQEELALETGVSARHVSFLETGRSQPGRAMVINLARVFNLSPQDLNTLFVAAGFAADPVGVDLGAEELGWLRRSLEFNMRALDPWAASALDKYGNVHLVNRGWLALHRRLLPEAMLKPPLNSYHLFFSERGLRPHLVDWEDVACRLLMTLQQEVLLSGDEKAEQILAELLDYPSIPGNWQRRAAGIEYMHAFKVRLRIPEGGVRSYLQIANTSGATPYVGEPRLLISLLMPEDLLADSPVDELLCDASLHHPLLQY